MIINSSVAKGQIIAPPSKSMAHRYLICASLAQGTSTIKNIDLSEDIKATLSCLSQLGAKYQLLKDENGLYTVKVEGCNGNIVNTSTCFDCNESGSTLRFFLPLAMLKEEPSVFKGSPVLLNRPLSIYTDICKEQGIALEKLDGQIRVQGKLRPSNFVIDANISSQFITGLLLTLVLLDKDSSLELRNTIESKPYIDMTLQVLNDFGIVAKWEKDNVLYIPGCQKYKATEAEVEGDYSNAAFFEALNTIGGNVEVKGLNPASLQGDKVYIELFKKLQNSFETIDISDCPDLGPILFSVAAAHKGGVFIGTKRLRIKESNRGAVMCEELAKFGVKTLMEDNKITIYQSTLKRPEVDVLGHNDHRIVMALATLLTKTGGSIQGETAVRKSFPDYFAKLRSLGIDIA